MLVAIHQPNFVPWFPFFEKMNLADKFIIMMSCQFEKGGYQNRYQVNGKWVTNPVKHGLEEIYWKEYTSGEKLYELNMLWINAIRKTLGITTPIVSDYSIGKDRKGSERLAWMVMEIGGQTYLTNPEAFDKYLDREPFDKIGIEIVPFKAQHKLHTFEMFEKFGIEGCRKILQKQKERFNAVRQQEPSTVDVR